MGQPRKKTEYRFMTPVKIWQDLERHLYQADKMRAEYAAKVQQKAREAEAWGRATGAQIETGARQFQRQMQTSADQAFKATQTRAQAIGQAAEQGAGDMRRRVQQGAAEAAQTAQRLQRDGAAQLQRGAAIVASQRDGLERRGAQTVRDMTAFADQTRDAFEGRFDQWTRDGRQTFDEVSDQADAWGRTIEDGARRGLKEAGDYADQTIEAIREAPHNADQAVRDWWRNDTRDMQKYHHELNDYERAVLLKQQGVTDPNSAEAHALVKHVLDIRKAQFEREKAAWYGRPAWQRLALSAGIGAEQGALKGTAEIARGIDFDPNTSFDDAYFTNRLPRTFAREEHPFAYLASHVAGTLGSDALLALTQPWAVPAAEIGGAFASGFVSEPGDLLTRSKTALGMQLELG